MLETTSASSTPRFLLAMLPLLVALPTGDASAFLTPTHAHINELAASSSPMIGAFLRDQLGLVGGLAEPLEGRSVATWIGQGGIAEDEFMGSETLGGLTRSARHFHTPLLGWDQAGLSMPPLPRFESSVRWAQSDQGLLGRAAWADARHAFFGAATGSTESARHRAYADTFLALGQLMHLVADLAQPAHTRDESHVLRDDFEIFMADTRNKALIAGFKTFDPGILRVPTGDPVARAPVAHIWDTNRYDGTNPPDEVTGATFGLAEFSNANFFSPGTISPRAHADPIRPLPALDILDLASIAPYVTGESRPYRGKSGSGVRVERMVTEGSFHRFLPPSVSNFSLDDLVFREYAGHLLPRAIGYAAGLLEHFFRGRLEIAAPARFAYGLAAFQAGNAGSFAELRFKVRNATPGEDAGPGQLVAVIQYRKPVTGGSLIDDPFADISDEVFFAVSQPIATALTASFQELAFDFTRSAIPANAADLFLTVAYRGPLGLEDDAVMVGGKDLFEPAPLDVGNATDWECFEGSLHHVADLTAYPPYRLPGQTQRDVNHDGVPDLAGPFVVRDQFVKTFDLAEPGSAPSETHFDLSIPTQGAAQYSRVMLLQDRPAYGATVLARETQSVPSGGIGTNALQSEVVPGVFNDVVRRDGQLVRRVLPSTVYRGVPLHFGLFLTTTPTLACLPETQHLEPPLTRIEATISRP